MLTGIQLCRLHIRREKNQRRKPGSFLQLLRIAVRTLQPPWSNRQCIHARHERDQPKPSHAPPPTLNPPECGPNGDATTRKSIKQCPNVPEIQGSPRPVQGGLCGRLSGRFVLGCWSGLSGLEQPDGAVDGLWARPVSLHLWFP